MRVLVIDNHIETDSWGSASLRRFARLLPSATFYVRRAPHGDLPANPSAFDRIIVSGSKTSALEDAPWISKLHEFIRATVDLKKPYLGVCYGHQALVRALGGKESCQRGADSEHGWTEIEVLHDSRLLEGLPKRFHSFSSHYDEVTRLPGKMRLLARSEACAVQACELQGYPVFGIQFHPEKDLKEALRLFQEWKKTGTPAQPLRADESDRLFDPNVGETIFRNFLSL